MKKLVSTIMLIVIAISMVGCKNSDDFNKKAVEDIVNFVMTAPSQELSMAEVFVSDSGELSKASGDVLVKATEELNAAVASKLSKYFTESAYKEFELKGYPYKYQTICIAKKIKLLPTSVSMTKGENNQYEFVINVTITDESNTETTSQSKCYATFDDDGKITAFQLNGTILHEIDPNHSLGV